MRPGTGKTLYGLVFVLVFPLALIAWAFGSADNVSLPAVRSGVLGGSAAIIGALLVLAGMVALMRKGGGLPMNAYPPPRYVSTGVYRLTAHPIYFGFGLLCIGCSVAFGSASGLWLVSPVAIGGTVALVLGYERVDLQERFGDDRPRPILSFPADDAGTPTVGERVGVWGLVLIPWLIMYEWLGALGVRPGGAGAYLPFEYDWPVLEWTEPLYLSTYLVVTLAPFIACTRHSLREFAIRGAIGTLLMPLFFLAFPLLAIPRPFAPQGFWGNVLIFERMLDTPANAFPSYHVIWIILAMPVYAARFPRVAILWWAFGAAVCASTMTTGMHAVIDVAAGILVAIGLMHYRRVWEFIRRVTERIANSWHEWTVGRVRIINHGVYAGIGSAITVFLVAALIGLGALVPVVFVAACALVASALWAQIVEGSPSLLRPYGFYGGVVGIIIGSILTWPLFGVDPWLFLAAYSVSGPWVQSFGRLRCLVQGCCHGRKAPASIGIVYNHPRSRVTRLSDLGGTPVHPTPLYSILWNVAIAIVLTRLWFGGAALSMIGGLYLILTGLGRFVEEAYRGEPQTESIHGLRFYQWIAILTVAAGGAVTCISTSAPPIDFQPGVEAAALGVGFGLITWFALGVDFPGSNKRFARLV